MYIQKNIPLCDYFDPIINAESIRTYIIAY